MIELVFGDAFNGGLAVDLLSAISSPPSACKQSPSSDTVTMYQGTIFDFLIEYPIMATVCVLRSARISLAYPVN